MTNPLIYSLGICCVVGILFWIIWLPSQSIAINLAYDEFRAKGFLELPTGFQWFSFLLRKHYGSFENSRARLFFTIAHICAIGVLLSMSAGVLVLGFGLLAKLIT